MKAGLKYKLKNISIMRNQILDPTHLVIDFATEQCSKKIYSTLGKEYVKAVYCHPAYLTYMQSTHMKCQSG